MRDLIRAFVVLCAATAAAAGPPASSYIVRWEGSLPPAFVVKATWPAAAHLEMDTTRPGNLPELLERGWPALIRNLRVTDGSGQSIEPVAEGAGGWRLPGGIAGPIVAEYVVDARLLAEHDWPAPCEAGFTDGTVLSMIGRALFITPDTMQSASVRFELPHGWRAYAPWRLERGGSPAFQIDTAEQLRENVIAITRRPVVMAEASGFRFAVVPTGDWLALEPELKRVARAHVRRFVERMDFRGNDAYLALLLPMRDQGAESYRQSFAVTFAEAPSRANEPRWANLLGHEVFHYWNGWRLRGADYPSSQWLQEGFTEYTANVSTVAAKLMTPEQFRDKLAGHVGNYRRLTTTLDNPGTHKGPPLYSGGALTAFIWDVSIREATDGKRDLADFLHALWTRCDDAARPYTNDDILAALRATADRDWAAFMDAHIRGTTPLPIETALKAVGLRLDDGPDGKPRVVEIAGADATARRTWQRLVRGD